MTESDKKYLRLAIGPAVLDGAVLIKRALPGGEEEVDGFPSFLCLLFQAPAAHSLDRLLKLSSGIAQETGFFFFFKSHFAFSKYAIQ